MRIEHVGYMVEDPVAVAAWYVEHLGFEIKREYDNPPTNTHFLADSSGQMMIEIYNNAKAAVPDYASMDPLLLHLGFTLEDETSVAKEHLLAAGASIVQDTMVTSGGDELTMLRDPWGLAIQLCRRRESMT